MSTPSGTLGVSCLVNGGDDVVQGYLAEPQNQAEQDKIKDYIVAADGQEAGLSAWWLGGNDLHR